MTRILPLASLLSVLSLNTALAQSPSPVIAEHPWARATAPQQKVGGGYVTLTSPADDRLIERQQSRRRPCGSARDAHGRGCDAHARAWRTACRFRPGSPSR